MNEHSTNQYAIAVVVGAFVDELLRAGVRNFVVCPGSRSTPLALIIARHSQARLWMQLDERSAAFFGLGMAKASQEPVALVCTSGTAAANFLPAVVEAFYARVPLLVITADRPHELRDCGAAQTIDQLRLYGSHVKWFADLAEPEVTPDQVRTIRTLASRAVATARATPAGPVHLNCPYREPFVPLPTVALDNWDSRPSRQPYATVTSGTRHLDDCQIAVLADSLCQIQRGLIICGPQDDMQLAEPLLELAHRLGYPVLADPLSGLRCGNHDHTLIVDCYDALLRNSDFVAGVAPELVLRFGAMPTSKPVLLYLQRYAECQQIVVDGGAGWNDPTHLAGMLLHADARQVCAALVDALSTRNVDPRTLGSWAETWQRANRLARQAITTHFATLTELFEGKVFAELAQLLPSGATLWAGNSMPVRDLDTFFAGSNRAIRLYANRGANGIDGVVSSALGASTMSQPLVLVIGDISFYHDSNGLLAAKQYSLDITIVVLNNNGGGIFSFLPQATETAHFETLFGTPHGLDFRAIAEMYGAHFTRPASWEEFRTALCNGVEGRGLHIVELITERQRNVELHREIWQVVNAALA